MCVCDSRTAGPDQMDEACKDVAKKEDKKNMHIHDITIVACPENSKTKPWSLAVGGLGFRV